MLNKLRNFLRQYDMVQPGDRVVCAVSGGADSVALLFAMYLLREKLEIDLAAAHFNHHLRGVESDRDEAFVRTLCRQFDIPLSVGSGTVTAGEKGLEAAARDARYAYFATLPGKIATAHTADDNAETVLMHLIRGTGLRGLGAIAPVRGTLIRPMLSVTRQEVLEFLEEYHLSYVTDSSNASDRFLRNRVRRHVMPLLKQENPRVAEKLSAMALQLRQDEAALSAMVPAGDTLEVQTLRSQLPSIRTRSICAFLERNGVREPETEHISLVEELAFSHNPSARADLPGGVTVRRNYGVLTAEQEPAPLKTVLLPREGTVELPETGLRVVCTPCDQVVNEPNCFTVTPSGQMVLRHRCSGDEIQLPGGKKSLKKLFIDRKIPAADRLTIPVVADDAGILGVMNIGADQKRLGAGVQIKFEKRENLGGFLK